MNLFLNVWKYIPLIEAISATVLKAYEIVRPANDVFDPLDHLVDNIEQLRTHQFLLVDTKFIFAAIEDNVNLKN
jgi:hypothetical protein